MGKMSLSPISRLWRNGLNKFFCGFAIVILLLGIIQIMSMWIVFEKDGRRGWTSIVPFYDMWVLAEIGGKSGWVVGSFLE